MLRSRAGTTEGSGRMAERVTGGLVGRSALALAALVRSGQVSAREVVQAHLDRIGQVNEAVNAVTRVLAEDALAAADRLEGARAAGAPLGPLAGVPVTVKENHDVAGTPTTLGVRAFAGQVAAGDAPAVARLRAAGAIPIARTNLPDFMLRWHTDSSLHGATRNPWDPDRTSGGSSGGDAVAVATGMAPLGLASDLGGSLRVPALANGVAALRPTPGRVPFAGAPERPPSMTQQLFAVPGPVGRDVADLHATLEVLAGPDPADPCRSPSRSTTRPSRQDVGGWRSRWIPAAVASTRSWRRGAPRRRRAGPGRLAGARGRTARRRYRRRATATTTMITPLQRAWLRGGSRVAP